MRYTFHVRRSGRSTAISNEHSRPGVPGGHEHFAPLPPAENPVDEDGGALHLPPTRPRLYPNHVLAKKYRKEHHHDYDQHVGAEPGVNPRSATSIAEYSHFKQDCVINVVDYDTDDATFRRVSNADLLQLMKREEELITEESDSGTLLPPRMVRWINVAGIDWSVLNALALKYSVSLLDIHLICFAL